ncbi:MAG: pilus assembly protein PilM [Planctomycetes bacterium]|nr:pilus assembly protein PilM [Planctomycetota bacterium]
MVKSIGIDPGDHSVKVVELEGSYRKTRLVRVHTASLAAAPDAVARAEAVAAAAEAAREEGMRGDVRLGHPCREAVLRVIELPFKGHDAIRKVVKAEVEGEIHSHTLDDMVVDFHEIGEGVDGGTRVLVASVPKPGLRLQIEALAAHGIEPETVDLDTMALWRAADRAGAFEVEAADAAPAGAPAAVTAIVDLGARSVKVLLVEGDRLVEMRTLRVGDAVVSDEIARLHGLDAATARDVTHECLRTGTDQRLDVAAALPVAAEGAPAVSEVEQPPARHVTIRFTEVDAAQTAYLQRLARELTRFLTASGRAVRIGALWITGGASVRADAKDMLREVFGVEPRELDLLSHLEHDLSPDEVDELGPRLVTAIGLALGRMGGPEGFDLRQEDLTLSRGFDKLKFPLAIACMVAWLALFVHANKRAMELKNLELYIGQTFIDKSKPNAPPQFHGMLNSVFTTRWFENAQNFRLEQAKGKDYTYKDLIAEITEAPVHKRLQLVRDKLRAVADQKQKQSGVYEDVSLESGLAVLVRWSEMLRTVEPQLGRYLVPRIELGMKTPSRRLEFTVAFRGEDFRERMSVLEQAIEAEYNKADTPFERPKGSDRGSVEERFRDSDETGISGAYYKVTMRVKDVFEPFGPSSSAAIGAASPSLAAPQDRVATLEDRR